MSWHALHAGYPGPYRDLPTFQLGGMLVAACLNMPFLQRHKRDRPQYFPNKSLFFCFFFTFGFLNLEISLLAGQTLGEIEGRLERQSTESGWFCQGGVDPAVLSAMALRE